MSNAVELGLVTEKELEQIKDIFARKSALLELSVTLSERGNTASDLYERIVNDLMAVNQRMGAWWEATAAAHGWAYSPSDSWGLDFASRKLTLRKSM